MRTGNILFSAVHFFVVLAILAIGGFFIALAKIPHVQFLISELFSENPSLFLPIGIFTMVLGGILMIGLYAMNRKRYYRVRMKFDKADVDEAVIHKYVEKYWQEIFPGQKFTTGVLLYPNRKIEVIAEIPDMPEEEQIELLEKVEIELGGIFARNLKYDRDFDLTVILK
jgi:hypothetical protein